MGNSAIGRGTAVEENKVKASSADGTPDFLDGKVGTSMQVLSDKLHVIGGTSGDVLTANGAGVAPTMQTPSAGAETLVSTTTVTAATGTGNVTIVADRIYHVILQGTMGATISPLRFTFNDDISASSYSTSLASLVRNVTTPTIVNLVDTLAEHITLVNSQGASLGFWGDFYIDTFNKASRGAFVWGHINGFDTIAGSVWISSQLSGLWEDNTAPTHFDIFGTNIWTGQVYLYEKTLA